MGNNFFTCTRNILAGKRVIEVVHREHSGTRNPNAFQWGGNPPKLALTMGGSGPPSNTWLLGPTAPHMPKAISTEPAVSSGLTLHYPYTVLWDSPFPTPKLPIPVGGSEPPSNTWCMSPTPPHMPNGISIGPAVLPQIHPRDQRQSNRLTDRQTMNMANAAQKGVNSSLLYCSF